MTDAENVRELISEVTWESLESLTDDRPLSSLTGGSFSLVELVITLQEHFGVRFGQADMQGVTTVGGLIALMVARSKAAA